MAVMRPLFIALCVIQIITTHKFLVMAEDEVCDDGAL